MTFAIFQDSFAQVMYQLIKYMKNKAVSEKQYFYRSQYICWCTVLGLFYYRLNMLVFLFEKSDEEISLGVAFEYTT